MTKTNQVYFPGIKGLEVICGPDPKEVPQGQFFYQLWRGFPEDLAKRNYKGELQDHFHVALKQTNGGLYKATLSDFWQKHLGAIRTNVQKGKIHSIRCKYDGNLGILAAIAGNHLAEEYIFLIPAIAQLNEEVKKIFLSER